MMLVYERLPDIWTKLSGDKNFWECIDLNSLPNMTLITNHWFLTLFINVLPIEVYVSFKHDDNDYIYKFFTLDCTSDMGLFLHVRSLLEDDCCISML